MRKVTVTLFLALVPCAETLLGADEPKHYSSVESYKASLPGLYISQERQVDINGDGKLDHLIYSGDEEKYLIALINESTQYALVAIPEGEDYEVIGAAGNYEIRVKIGTFPMFGDIHGPDKYYWYDHYKITGHSLKLTNAKHGKFYKEMLPLYRQRIKELEQEILDLKHDSQAGKIDESIFPTLAQFLRDQIDRYGEFIQKASKIIGRSK